MSTPYENSGGSQLYAQQPAQEQRYASGHQQPGQQQTEEAQQQSVHQKIQTQTATPGSAAVDNAKAAANPTQASSVQQPPGAYKKRAPPQSRLSRIIELTVLFLVAGSVLMVFVSLFVQPLYTDISDDFQYPRFILISIPMAVAAFATVLLGAFRKIPMRIGTVRMATQGLVLYALNATFIGSLYVAPFLPTLRFRHMAYGSVGGVPLCSIGSTTRCFSNNWMDVAIGPAFWVILMFIALIAVLFLVGILVGRGMCSWVCPIGLLHDIVTRFRTGLKINRKEFSQETHDRLSLIRFALMAFFLLLALSIGTSLLVNYEAGKLYQEQFKDLPLLSSGATVCEFCPSPITAYFVPTSANQIVAGDFNWNTENILRMSMFILVWVGAFIMPRFFCRYICWQGAIISPANKISLLTLHKDQKKCTKCNYCVDACPMRVRELRDESIDCRIDNLNCTYCLECIDHCPEKALEARFGSRTVYRGGKNWWERFDRMRG